MKVPAFTLIEVVIALAVLSIVTGLTYNGFSYLAQSTKGYINNTASHLELMGFANRVEADFTQAEAVFKGPEDAIEMEFYNGEHVRYQMRNAHLVRFAQGITDSIAANTLTLYMVPQKESFEGKELIQEITINAQLFNQAVPLYFFKPYHAAQYLERL